MSDDILKLMNSLALGRRGRRPDDVPMDYIGPITPQDIKLFVENPIACTTPYVQKLRHSHHAIARHIASGKRVMEIAQITNYTPHRIHGLQGDPAFIELVSYYRAQVDAAFADAQVKLAMLGGDTIEVLHERLSDDPETFTNRELIALMESTMDRSVAPKKGGAGGVGSGGGGGAPLNLNISFVAPAQQQQPAIPKAVVVETADFTEIDDEF